MTKFWVSCVLALLTAPSFSIRADEGSASSDGSAGKAVQENAGTATGNFAETGADDAPRTPIPPSRNPLGIFYGLNRPNFINLPPERWTAALVELRRMGFDTVVVRADERMLEEAERKDFSVITYLGGGSDEKIAAYEAHPNLIAWYGVDEPGRSGKLPQARRMYREMEGQTSRPLAVSLYLPSAYPEANELADILMPDPYIFGYEGPGGVTYAIEEVAFRIGSLRGHLKGGRRIWAVPQLFAWHPFFKRPPTPAELEASTMMCLGEGATGIVYFSLNSGSYYPDSPDFEPAHEGERPVAWDLRDRPELVRAVKRVNKRVRFILNRFDRPASREWTGGGMGDRASGRDGDREVESVLRYRWDNGTDSLTVEITLGEIPRVRYDF